MTRWRVLGWIGPCVVQDNHTSDPTRADASECSVSSGTSLSIHNLKTRPLQLGKWKFMGQHDVRVLRGLPQSVQTNRTYPKIISTNPSQPPQIHLQGHGLRPTLLMNPIEILRRQYYALYPPYLLSLPPPSQLASFSVQNELVERILIGNSGAYGPERGYARLFWRIIVGVLEQGVKELLESGDGVSCLFVQAI